MEIQSQEKTQEHGIEEKTSTVKRIVVSDREILRIIKEEKRFPLPFSNRVKLSTLLKFYDKYWNGDFTDDSDSETN
jgi:hypothetical protein